MLRSRTLPIDCLSEHTCICLWFGTSCTHRCDLRRSPDTYAFWRKEMNSSVLEVGLLWAVALTSGSLRGLQSNMNSKAPLNLLSSSRFLASPPSGHPCFIPFLLGTRVTFSNDGWANACSLIYPRSISKCFYM